MRHCKPLVAKPPRLPFFTQPLIKWSTTRLPMLIVPKSSTKVLWACAAIVAKEVGIVCGKDSSFVIMQDPNPAFSNISRLHSRVVTDRESGLLEASSHRADACDNYISGDSSRRVFGLQR